MDGSSPVALQTIQRHALHCEIRIASTPRHAPAQSLAAIVKAFAASSAKREALWLRGQAAFEITQVRFNKAGTRAILLLRHKEADSEASAHLVIDLTPSPKDADAYDAILEQAPGLTMQRLELAMQALARRLFEFYFKDASGNFRQAYPGMSFAAHQETLTFTVERELAQCESEIRPDVSARLDSLLKRQTSRLAA
jgi:hypothetical protein